MSDRIRSAYICKIITIQPSLDQSKEYVTMQQTSNVVPEPERGVQRGFQ